MANLSRTLIKEKHVFNSFWLINLDLVKNNYIFVLLYFDLHHKVYFLLTSLLIPYILKYECNLQNRVNVLTKHIAEVHDTFVWNHVCLFFFNIHSCKINNEVKVTYFCVETHVPYKMYQLTRFDILSILCPFLSISLNFSAVLNLSQEK